MLGVVMKVSQALMDLSQASINEGVGSGGGGGEL